MLSEISQTEKDKYCMISFLQRTLKKTNKLVEKEIKFVVTWGGCGEGEIG